MGDHRRSPKLRDRLDPLLVLSTAVRALLNQHQSSFQQEEYNLLLGSLRAKTWSKLLDWASAQDVVPADHTEYGPGSSYLIRRELAALIRKFAFTPEESGLDPEGAALKTFMRSERRCKLTNRSLRLLTKRLLLSKGEVVVEKRVELYRFLTAAKSYIARVLGAKPNMESIYGACDFGGGASVGVHGNATNIGRKFLANKWTCTATAVPFAFAAIMANHHAHALLCPVDPGHQSLVALETYRAAFEAKLCLIDYNKLEFVSKSAKTHRVIATEPLLNGFLQKGIDTVMRRLMAAHGIDLKYGWQLNQHLAYLGSLGGENPFATLDLSAASDSLCLELVRFLLPPRWFALLNSTRSPGYRWVKTGTKIQDVPTIRTDKFCSMGNGFCFPLETLIFAAFANVSCKVSKEPVRFVVYGDDIIVKDRVVPVLVSSLERVGFRLNLDKSYATGPFRESCGADWVRGQGVTPVYMRKRITTIKQLVDFHNSLQFKCFGAPFQFEGVTSALRDLVPLESRFVELYRPGQKPLNTGFLVRQDEFMQSPHIRWMRDTYTWEAKGFHTQSVPDMFEHPLRNGVEYLAVLRGATSAMPLALRRETKTRVGYDDQRARDRHLMIASGRYLPSKKL